MVAMTRSLVLDESRREALSSSVKEEGGPVTVRPGMKTRSVPGGSMVFVEGDPAGEAFVIVSGMVEISIRKNGRKVVLARLAEGQMFGEMAIISQERRSATAYCLSDCELMVVDRATIEQKVKSADPYLRFLVRSLIDMVRQTSQRV